MAGADHRSMIQRLSMPAGGRRYDLLAVAQHRDGVGDLQHVVEEMGDEDDAPAALAQAPQHPEQPLDLGRRQGRGRLVQDDDARAGEQDAAELDELLHADG